MTQNRHMNTRPSVRTLLLSCGPWLAVVIIPLTVNVAVWRVLVVPQQATLRAWRNAQVLTEFQPKLVALLSESRQTLAEWRRTSFASDDPSAAIQAVKRLAGRHHVQLKQLSASGAVAQAAHAAPSSRGAIPVEVEATGRFSHLAHWLNEVETQSGLQVDTWELALAKAADQSCRLTVKMTAFLREV